MKQCVRALWAAPWPLRAAYGMRDRTGGLGT